MSTSSQSIQPASEQGQQPTKKRKTSTEILVLSSSDNENDDLVPFRVRPRLRLSSSPLRIVSVKEEVDADEFAKAYDRVAKAVGDEVGIEQVMFAYKKSRHDIDATIKLLKQHQKKSKKAEAAVAPETKDKGKDKEKGKANRQHVAQQAVDDNDKLEEDVDELESDPEDDGVKDMEWWLDVEKRDQARQKIDLELVETYKTAALDQLSADWQKVELKQIKQVFENLSSFYAPAWFELLKIKRAGHLVEIKKARDIEYRLQQQVDPDTGVKVQVKVKRDPPKESRTLEAEKKWLIGFKKGGYGKGKGKGKTFDIPEFKRGQHHHQPTADGKALAETLPPRKKANADPSSSKSISKASPSASKARPGARRPACPTEAVEEGHSDGSESERGAPVLATTESKKRRHERPDRFTVYHDGKKVDRKAREGTTAFSGKGRTLE